MRAIICSAVMALTVTAAFAGDDDYPAMLKRAIVEAHCPKVVRGNAERAIRCIGGAERKLFAEHWPEAIDLYDKILEAELLTARKYDAGKLSVQQYTDESKARRAELVAKIGARQREAQCAGIIKLMLDPWADSPTLQALMLEKARSLRCL